MKYAFKCRACGHLEEAGAAGQRAVPAACHACGAGVGFDPQTGAKRYAGDNWIVLADLPAGERDDVLKFHGIKKADIERHEPLVSEDSREPQTIERAAEETVGAEDHA